MRGWIDVYGNDHVGAPPLFSDLGIELKSFYWFFGISLESGLTAMFTFSLDFLRRKEVRTWASATQRNKATTMAARLSGPMLLMLDQSFLDMFATSRLRWDTEVISDCRSLFKKFCSSITDAFLFPLRFYLHMKLISASLSLCQGQCFDLLNNRKSVKFLHSEIVSSDVN